MTTLKFNERARQKRIKELAKGVIQNVKDNMSKGIRKTEIYIDKNFATDAIDIVRTKLGDKFTWCTVRTGTNPHTGRTEYFWGMTVGDDRYYKVRYKE